MIHLITAMFVSCTMLALPEPPVQPTSAPLKEPLPPQPLPSGSIVYHTLTGRDAQVIFTSDAPLEKVVGKSNAVVGFAIPGPKDQPAKLFAARWILPVRSLATGLPLRDEHMVGSEWLDADAFANIEFSLSRVEDIKEIKRGEGFSTWSATMIGEMTIHGVKRELRVPDSRLSFFEESAKTKSIAAGDLLFLKCEYAVKLSDFGIKNGDVPTKVSDTVKLSQTLRLSTVAVQDAPAAAEGASTDAGR